VGDDQLALALAPRALPGHGRRVRRMEATAGAGPFDDPAYLFEPWWPGSRGIVRIAGGRVRIEADELADLIDAVPDLDALAGRIGPGDAVLDGVVLVLDPAGRPDAQLLRRRLAERRFRDGTPAFVAVDALVLGGRSVAGRPFAERRERLADAFRPADWCLVSRGFPGEGHTVAVAVSPLGFTAVSAHRLDAPYVRGPAGDAWIRLPLEPVDPAPRMPPLLAVYRSLQL
jgi:bifunctional non-homologous end joining protein LigD